MSVPENKLRLVFIGKTGTGKSKTGNSILGIEAFKSKLGGASVTKKCSYEKNFNYGREISIVDTPGLFDTAVANAETSAEIIRCVSLSSPGPHAIVFVTRIGRYTNEERKTIQFFVDQFGVGMYKYMIVLFTGGDDLKADGITLEEFIRDSPPELKEVIRLAGGRTVAFDNRDGNPAAKKQQVEALFSLVDSTVQSNGGGCYTNEMYRAAEALLREREAAKRRAAEAAKKAEEDRIKAECKSDMKEELEKLNKRHLKELDAIRHEHLKKIAELDNKDGLFTMWGKTIGKTLDKAVDAVGSVGEYFKNLF